MTFLLTVNASFLLIGWRHNVKSLHIFETTSNHVPKTLMEPWLGATAIIDHCFNLKFRQRFLLLICDWIRARSMSFPDLNVAPDCKELYTIWTEVHIGFSLFKQKGYRLIWEQGMTIRFQRARCGGEWSCVVSLRAVVNRWATSSLLSRRHALIYRSKHQQHSFNQSSNVPPYYYLIITTLEGGWGQAPGLSLFRASYPFG